MASDNPKGPVGRGTALVLLGLVVLLWGANWPVMKIGLRHIGPLQFALARMSMGAIIMFAVAALAGQLRWPHRQDWPVVLSVGIVQMSLFMALANVALQYVPAGRSAILAYTTSLWVAPLAWLLLGERLGNMKRLGVASGMAGVLVMFNPLAVDWSDGKALMGNGLLLLSALMWAALMVQIRGHRWRGTPLSLLPWQFSVAVMVLLPLTLTFEGNRAVDWSGELWAILIYNGPLATAFCFWAMITVTRALPAVTTALGSLGVPVVGLIASALVVGEPLTGTNLTGVALIGGGLAAVILADGRRLSVSPRDPTKQAAP